MLFCSVFIGLQWDGYATVLRALFSRAHPLPSYSTDPYDRSRYDSLPPIRAPPLLMDPVLVALIRKGQAGDAVPIGASASRERQSAATAENVPPDCVKSFKRS